jgi:hypothetical protein
MYPRAKSAARLRPGPSVELDVKGTAEGGSFCGRDTSLYELVAV